VTTRHGGVSEAPYETLNVSHSVGDDRAAVDENRLRVAAAAGFDPAEVVFPALVQGVDVLHATRDDAAPLLDPVRPWSGDGAFTTVSGLPLMVTVADCVPVFVASLDGRVGGVLHAGWRCVVGGILPRAIDAIAAATGIAATELCVAIGPSIGACCFEVGDDVADRFAERLEGVPGAVIRPSPAIRARVDLHRALAAQSAAAGVPGTLPAPPCTRCARDRYFSHRGVGGQPTGRLLAALHLV